MRCDRAARPSARSGFIYEGGWKAKHRIGLAALAARLATTIALAGIALLMAEVLGWPMAAPVELSPARVLLTGPLVETLAMLALAALLTRALRRCRHSERAATLVCAAVIGLSFSLSHVAQQGVVSLLSLPMALWLSLLAARAALPGTATPLARGGGTLFLQHAIYNLALLLLSDLHGSALRHA